MIFRELLLVALASSTVACARGSVIDVGASGGSGTDTTEPHGAAPNAPPAEGEPAPHPKTIDVEGTYTLDLACSDIPIIDLCVISAKGEKDVAFDLPAGTKRSAIQYIVDPHGPDASGSVNWASDDPADATVHMTGRAGPFSNVHIEVTGVTAVSEN
jgi:hypothetical protein